MLHAIYLMFLSSFGDWDEKMCEGGGKMTFYEGLFEMRVQYLIHICRFGNYIDFLNKSLCKPDLNWMTHTVVNENNHLKLSCHSLVTSFFLPSCAVAAYCIQSFDNFSSSTLFPVQQLSASILVLSTVRVVQATSVSRKVICIGCLCTSGWIIHDSAYCQLGLQGAKIVSCVDCQACVIWKWQFLCLFS